MEVESETVGERDRGRGNKRGSMQVGGGVSVIPPVKVYPSGTII